MVGNVQKNAYHDILGLFASVIHTCDFTDLYSEDKYNKHHVKKDIFFFSFLIEIVYIHSIWPWDFKIRVDEVHDK